MAGTVTVMSKIKQLLTLYQSGQSKKAISAILSISRNTVKSYLLKLSLLNTDIKELLMLDDMELEQRFHGGNPAYTELQKYNYLKEQLNYFSQELKRVGVTRHLLWEEYKEKEPNGYGYSQFCYHLSQLLKARKPSMVMHYKPAEKLYVDFAGAQLQYVDKATGEIIKCPVLVCTLPYSDYGFIMALRNQTTVEVVYGLSMCMSFLGGATQILVTDNMKSAIVQTSRYEPKVNQIMQDFCNHYGMGIVPARPYKPKDKSLVENKVKNYYTQIFARIRNQTFFSLEELNDAIGALCIKHNQRRMQVKPYTREEKFIAEEREKLMELPKVPFEIKHYREHKVSYNNHIYLGQDNHYYSVPYEYTGKQVKVIYTRKVVKIYFNRELIAEHPRSFSAGSYTTKAEHLCSHHQAYLQRSPEKYRQRALERNIPELTYIIDRIFCNGKHPEQNYRTCEGLFSLENKCDKELLIRAFKTAIDCDSESYRFIIRVIEQLKLAARNGIEVEDSNQAFMPLPRHENERRSSYYS